MHLFQKAALAIAMTMQFAIVSQAALVQAPQKYPTKPIRIVLTATPGVTTDTLARMMGEKMSSSWGRAVVVDNRPGAGGILAGSTVAKAAPDGHTLLMVPGFAITAVMQPALPYDPLIDFAGVTQLGFGAGVLIVAPVLGAKSLKELIALAKSQPGKIIYGSAAPGSGLHLTGARIIRVAGIDVTKVAFKGSQEATIEVLAGRTHYAYVSFTAAKPFIQDGKLVALALDKRLPVLPDVPALPEILPDLKQDFSSFGLLAPAGTPRPILHQLSRESARILDLPDIKVRLNAIGFAPAPSTPEEYDKILREQIDSLSKLVRELGLKAR